MGNPQEFKENTIEISENSNLSRTQLLNRLVQSLYSRSISDEFKQGKFRIIGDTIDIFPAHTDFALKYIFLEMKLKKLKNLIHLLTKLLARKNLF